jgi:hypothetical protein
MDLSSRSNQQQQQHTTELGGVPLNTASLIEEEDATQRSPTFGDGSLLGIIAGLWTDMAQPLVRGHHGVDNRQQHPEIGVQTAGMLSTPV